MIKKSVDVEERHQEDEADRCEDHPELDRSCKSPDELVDVGETSVIEESDRFHISLGKAKEELDDIECETEKSEEKELCARVIHDTRLHRGGGVRFENSKWLAVFLR